MGQFQYFHDNKPVGPVRDKWEEAAADGIAAGHAMWVDPPFMKLIRVDSGPGNGVRDVSEK